MSQSYQWPMALLNELLVDMQPGFARRPNTDEGGVPQLRTNNISSDGRLDLSEVKYVTASIAELDKYGVRRGDVIFNNTNSPELVGRTAYFDLDREFVLSNHMTRLRVKPELLDPQFLARYLHYLWLKGALRRWAKHWVNQAAIDQSALAKIPIPIPPLPEQRRIVAILRKADELRQLRRRANQRARDLLPALFYEMFLSNDTNLHEWGSVSLGKITSFVTSGSRGWARYYSDKGGLFIRVQDIGIGDLTIYEPAYVNPPDTPEKERSAIQSGDLLITITGTVGRVAVAPNNLGEAYVSQHVAIVRLDGSLPSEFVAAYLNHPLGGQRQIQRQNYGQTKPGLNLTQIRAIEIPKPPKELVEQFVSMLAAYKDMCVKAEASETQLGKIAASLLARAFTGELTAAWREAHADELRAAAAERDRLLGLVKKPEQVAVDVLGDTQALEKALSNLSSVANVLASSAAQAALPAFTRFAEALRPHLHPLAEEANRGLYAALEPLADGTKKQIIANVRPLTEALRARYAPEFADLAEKISELARLQLEEPILRREIEARVLAVAAQSDGYITLPDLAADWRLNHFPRQTIQEAVDMLVVRGQLRPATLKLETGDPGRPYALASAYAPVRAEDKITADEIDL